MSAGKSKTVFAADAAGVPGESASSIAVSVEGAARKVYDASARINGAREKLEKLKALYGSEQPAHRQCEDIDDDLLEALRLLGE